MAEQVNIQEIGDEAIYAPFPNCTTSPTPKSGRTLNIPVGYKELRNIKDSTGRVIWAHKWRINVTCGTGGSASANPTRVKDGKTSTLSALASNGYSFSKWSDGNTQNPRTITVTDHISLTASFGQSNYPYKFVNDDNTTVLDSGTVHYNETP